MTFGGIDWGKPRKASFTSVDDLAYTQTEDLLNTSLECYRWVSLFRLLVQHDYHDKQRLFSRTELTALFL
jgi:hypothetical protein